MQQMRERAYRYPLSTKTTLLENLKICPKIQLSEKVTKIVNLSFRAKNQSIIVIMIHWFLLDFFEFKNFQIFLILHLHKVTIIGAKIQIIQVDLAFKNLPTSLLFSWKIQIDNFEIFGKLNIWTQFEISHQCAKTGTVATMKQLAKT